MAEYISKDELKTAILKRLGISGEQYLTHSEKLLVDVINKMPPADVLERKTGVWIGDGDGYADGVMVYDIWSCGCCGTRFDEWEEEPDWKYCPVCGSYNGGDDDV